MNFDEAAKGLGQDKRIQDAFAKKGAALERVYGLQSTVADIDQELVKLVDGSPDAVARWYREMVRVGGQYAVFYPGAPWSYPTTPL